MTSVSLNVLAIMAHPDDIEFTCAGTLLLLKELGASINLVNLARGDCGSATESPSVIAAIRLEEAQRAAEMLAAKHFCAGWDDLTIYRNDISVRRVTEIVRRAHPDVVFTHPPVDYMSDHEETSRMVRDACFYAPMPNYETKELDPAPAAKSTPFLYYCDPIEGVGHDGLPAPAEFHINISEVFQKKAKMLCCHASQRLWLRTQHGIDEYVEMLRKWNRSRGSQVGCEYSEAFVQYKGHGFPRDNRLAGLLGGRVFSRGV